MSVGEGAAPIEATIDLTTDANVRRFLHEYATTANETELLRKWVPQGIHVRLWPERVARGGLGVTSEEGYVVFDLVHVGQDGIRTCSYLVICDLQGTLIAAYPGPYLHPEPGHTDMSWVNALKLKDPETLLLGLNIYVEKGPVHLLKWASGEITAVANSSMGEYGSAHDAQWYVGGEDHALSKLVGAAPGVWRALRACAAHGGGIALYDAQTGAKRWNVTVDNSFQVIGKLVDVNHFQVLDMEGMAIINGRMSDNFAKVNLWTREVMWICGGTWGDFDLVGADGTEYAARSHHLWAGQHNLEYYGDGLYLMFDNGFNTSSSTFVAGRESRLLALRLDEASMVATIVNDIGLGEQTPIFGDNDQLPSGNWLATDWPRRVNGASALDRANFDAHIFEVEPATGDLAWDLRVWGDKAEEDADDDGGYDRSPHGESPVGWATYSVERWYTAPLLRATACARNATSGEYVVRFDAFSSFKSSDHHLGRAVLARSGGAELRREAFAFLPHWMPAAVVLGPFELAGAREHELTLTVTDQWGQERETAVECSASSSS